MASATSQPADPSFPSKPIRFILPFPPGGSSDIQARLIGQKITASWGQPVIVEHRAGANGIVAAEIAAHAVPDGHVLFLGHAGTHAANPGLYASLPYDARADFTPIIQTITQPMVLVASPTLPVNSVKDLMGLARREPRKLLYASAGTGSLNHIAGEMFTAMVGLDMVHVPYKGSSPAELDVISGRVTLFFDPMLSAMPFIRDGRLKALAVTSGRRATSLPDTMTMAEAGLPGYEFMTWNGLFAPSRTPAGIVARLNDEINRIMRLPDVQKRLTADGAEIVGGSAETFAAYVERERDKLARVIRATGIRSD